MPLNAQDARALTYLACRIRKETHGAREWDEAGTFAIISELVGHNLPLTVERVTRHAGDAEAKTPGAIKRPFVPAAQVAGPRFPARAGDEECRVHPGEWADQCRSCAADRLVGDTTPTRPPVAAGDAAPRVARLREIARDATADHCSHGVDRRNCLDHRATKTTPPTEGA